METPGKTDVSRINESLQAYNLNAAKFVAGEISGGNTPIKTIKSEKQDYIEPLRTCGKINEISVKTGSGESSMNLIDTSCLINYIKSEVDLIELEEPYMVDNLSSNTSVRAGMVNNRRELGVATKRSTVFNSEKERPLACIYCNKTFKNSSKLKNHVRTHTGERPFECQQCDKTFIERTHLNRHLRTHNGERPFVCPHCDKAFISGTNLKNHIRTHTGERPYACPHCDNKFKTGSGLCYHIHTHSRDRPFVCAHCDKTFKLEQGLNKHLRTHN